jgi:RNA recognition motif-containing protein
MPDDCNTLFVKNLPYNMAEDDIGDRFRHFGELANIRVAYNWQTKLSKGFAYIEFKEHASAKAALQKMHGKMILGRPLHVDYDANKQKNSYKPREETERNRLYNRESLREEKTRHVRKEKENKRMELIKKQ